MPGNIATLFNLDSGLFGTYGFLSGSPITARSLTLWKQKVNWRKKHRALAMAALRRTAVQHPK